METTLARRRTIWVMVIRPPKGSFGKEFSLGFFSNKKKVLERIRAISQELLETGVALEQTTCTLTFYKAREWRLRKVVGKFSDGARVIATEYELNSFIPSVWQKGPEKTG